MKQLINALTPGGYFNQRKKTFLSDLANLFGIFLVLAFSYFWFIASYHISFFFLTILLVSLTINNVFLVFSLPKNINHIQIKLFEQEFREVIADYLKNNDKNAIISLEKLVKQDSHHPEIAIFYQFLCKTKNNAKIGDWELQEPSISLHYLLNKKT